MVIQMELYELKNLISDSARLGVLELVNNMEPAKDAISQREAYRAYGEARVKAWVASGLINRTRNGSTRRTKILYSQKELAAVNQAEKLNRIINSRV